MRNQQLWQFWAQLAHNSAVVHKPITSEAFTGQLTRHGITISMDGVGRAFDNIMVERLWRTVKYEDVYIRDYKNPAQARSGL
jgi:putative transposase